MADDALTKDTDAADVTLPEDASDGSPEADEADKAFAEEDDAAGGGDDGTTGEGEADGANGAGGTDDAAGDDADGATAAAPAKPQKDGDDTAAAPAKPPTPPPAPPAADDTPQTAPSAITFDFDAIASEAMKLPDKVKVGDTEVDVKTFAADFPEVLATITHSTRRAVEEYHKRVAPYLEFVQAQYADRQRDQLLSAVTREVGEDARAVGDSAEFADWLKAQPKALQQMAIEPDVKSAVFVMKAYRAENPRPNAAPANRASAAPAASPAFDRRKGALMGTVGGKATPKKSGVGAQDDYISAFNED